MMNGSSGTFRLAVVGSCQVVGLREAAKHLLTGASIDIWHVGVHPIISDSELIEQLSSYDLTITQIDSNDRHPLLTVDSMRASGIRSVYLPTIVFNGFHPDLTYLHGPSGILRGVDADYHSIIAACSFSLGLSEARAASLFNSLVFRTLGYFQMFSASRDALLVTYSSEGYEIDSLFTKWIDSVGAFMHTINHPHIIVLLDLCRAALIKMDVPINEFDDFTILDDALYRHTVFPVYPELAESIGVSGSRTILSKSDPEKRSGSREVTISDYIELSYGIYRDLPVNTLPLSSQQVSLGCGRLKALLVA